MLSAIKKLKAEWIKALWLFLNPAILSIPCQSLELEFDFLFYFGSSDTNINETFSVSFRTKTGSLRIQHLQLELSLSLAHFNKCSSNFWILYLTFWISQLMSSIFFSVGHQHRVYRNLLLHLLIWPFTCFLPELPLFNLIRASDFPQVFIPP